MSFRITKKNTIQRIINQLSTKTSSINTSSTTNTSSLINSLALKGSEINSSLHNPHKSSVVTNLSGTKIISDISGQFGWAIDTDNTGRFVVVGAPTANSSVGYARVYSISSTNTPNLLFTTSQLVAASSLTGFSVSISGLGNVIAVGAPGHNSNNGGVLIYTNNNGIITYNTLISPSAPGAYVGQFVKLNHDGTVLAIGAPLFDVNFGRVWIYKFTTSWNLVQVIDRPADTFYFGDVISMNSNGNKIFIGSRSAITGGIFCRVYVANLNRSTSQWDLNNYFTGIPITTTSLIADVDFDIKASLDDNYLVISCPSQNNTIGTAAVLSLSPGNDMVRSQFIIRPIAGEVGFGYKVCISGDSKTIYISSATNESNEGQIWVYRQNKKSWIRVLRPFRGTGDIGQPQQGFAIACNISGSRLMIGGPFDNLNKGAYWTFI